MQWFANYDEERASVCEYVSNSFEPKLTGEEITSDEYEGFILSSLAAGSEEMKEAYIAMKEREKIFSSMKPDVASYNYNQKSRHDSPKYILGFPTDAAIRSIRYERDNKKTF